MSTTNSSGIQAHPGPEVEDENFRLLIEHLRQKGSGGLAEELARAWANGVGDARLTDVERVMRSRFEALRNSIEPR